MKKKGSALLIALMALLIAVVPVFAITWGQPDTDNEYPYVGTLLFQQGEFYYSCTGTLLSPWVVLTAAHCTEEAGEVNIGTWVSFEPQISLADWDRENQTRADYLDASDTWVRGTAIPHPMYEGNYPNTYDVGLVVLWEPVYMSEYGQLPEIGLLETLVTGLGRQYRQFTAVGYGMQGVLNPVYQDDWERYIGHVSLIEINSNSNGPGHSAKFTNNPGKGNGSGGTCYGDSGGPVFYRDTNIVGAVVSWGITPCIGVDYQFRVDTAIAQDFILPILNSYPLN